MKTRKLALLTLLASLCVQAEVLTPAQALQRAADRLPQTIAPARRAAAARNAEPLLTIGSVQPEVYLFGSAAGGIVVASAESETESALLGYSEVYSEGAELPPSLKWLMGYYGQEIRALRNGDVVERTLRRVSGADFAPIAPICKTTWNQGTPYCYDCPVVGDYYTVTGCVATAMAQVLKTYEYPAKCSGGTFSYTWKNGNKTLSKNFNDITLDWANMLDSYPSSPGTSLATSKAVANLMSAVGYASRMNYSTSGSGTSGMYCAEGMVRNFGYDYTLQYLEMDWFDLADWQQKIYNELAAGHPVYYDGVNNKERVGHAFVVDGYQSDGYFHVNWGWGGQLDGYFLLTALDPDGQQGIGGSSGGYSEGAGAIFNMSPGKTMTAAEAPLTMWGPDPMQVPSATTVGGSFTDAVVVYNMAPFSSPECYFAWEFTGESGESYFSSVAGLPELGIAEGIGGRVSLAVPDDLPSGRYVVKRIVYNQNSGKTYDVFYDQGTAGRICATVSGRNVTFSEYTEPLEDCLFFDAVELPSTIYFDEEFTISSIFCNATSEEYTGRIYLNFYRKGTSEVVLGLQTEEFTLPSMQYVEFNPSVTITFDDIEPGEYTIGLACDDESVVSKTQTVTIRRRPAVVQGSNFECASTAVNNIGFKVDLTALNSDYSGTVALVIAKNKNSSILWSDLFDLNLAAGETIIKSYSEIDLTDKLTVGSKYIIYGVYVNENGKSTAFGGESSISFTATPQQQQSLINDVRAADQNIEYFDLSGRRVMNPSTGVYLRRQNANTQKIILR